MTDEVDWNAYLEREKKKAQEDGWQLCQCIDMSPTEYPCWAQSVCDQTGERDVFVSYQFINRAQAEVMEHRFFRYDKEETS